MLVRKPFRKQIGKCVRWGWQCVPYVPCKDVLLYRSMLSPWLLGEYPALLISPALLGKQCFHGRRNVLWKERLLWSAVHASASWCCSVAENPAQSARRTKSPVR